MVNGATMTPEQAVELLGEHIKDPGYVHAVYGENTTEVLRGAIGMLLAYTRGLQSLCTKMGQSRAKAAHEQPLVVGDVVQLDPNLTSGGPLLCVVYRLESDGARVAAWVPSPEPYKPPGGVAVKVKPEEYIRIGRAEWMPDDIPDDDLEGD